MNAALDPAENVQAPQLLFHEAEDGAFGFVLELRALDSQPLAEVRSELLYLLSDALRRTRARGEVGLNAQVRRGAGVVSRRR